VPLAVVPVATRDVAGSAEPVVASVGSATVVEADSGDRVVVVPVTLSQPSAVPVKVDYVVVGNSAVADSDFRLASGRISFGLNKTTGLTAVSKTVAVRVISDKVAEPYKTATVRLWQASGAVLGVATADVGIVDDDVRKTVRAAVGDVGIVRPRRGAAAKALVGVTLAAPAATELSLKVSIGGGSAVRDVDYKGPTSKIVKFKVGQARKTVTLTILPRLTDSPRTVYAAASEPSGLSIIRATGTVTIQPPADATPEPPASVYWGAWVGKQFTGVQPPWDIKAMSAFETMVGKRASLINFSAPFANCYVSPCTFYKFDTAAFDNARKHGSIPFFSWGSGSIPQSANQPDFKLSKVASGQYDAFIKTWVAAAKSWGKPFFLRFNWEMNGSWFPWGVGANGNTASDYVAAWRHVHDLFVAGGALNATWVWCPNVDTFAKLAPLPSLYPGDAYVDWTCLDGYNWGTNPNGNNGGWQPFDRIYASTYQAITTSIAPTKPMVIGEVASTEYGGSKASWITDAIAVQLPSNYPQVRGVLWFEQNGLENMDWPVESSSTSRSSFSAAIADSRYAENDYGSISVSPIPPP
jgi:mannan endo-1,4-beta-mannosidase